MEFPEFQEHVREVVLYTICIRSGKSRTWQKTALTWVFSEKGQNDHSGLFGSLIIFVIFKAIVNGWLDQLGLLSTFVNDHCQVLLGLQEKGFTWLAEQLYSVTNPNAESVGRGLNMMEQYQAQADTFWILIRRLETRNYSVQESHVPRQLQPRHGCCSKCYSLS